MKGQMDQQNWTADDRFPEHLRSYDSLAQHFRAQLEGISTTKKGDTFTHFALKLIPQTDVGADFDIPVLSERKSGDEGVDLTAQGKDGSSVLYIQSRLHVDRAETIDSILSKFQAYLESVKPSGQLDMFKSDDRPSHFLLVTLSPLTGVLDRYKQRGWASKPFYEECSAQRRLHFVDGHQIFPILRAAYSKISQLPSNLVLNLATPVIQKDNVFFGIISSVELKKLYDQLGDALFFENIRDFLGLSKGQERVGRTTVNEEIVKTITTWPDKMLERNNGIVFRADKVQLGESGDQLRLSTGSVVNGCQTTMCLVDYGDKPCYVSVKVVQTSDSWEIAKAANHQNSVPDIDLDLARNLRPQLAKRAANLTGIQLDDGEKSAFQIIDEIYARRVAYNETRLLYIGLFSRTPNNIFAANYTELRLDLIDRFYQDDPYSEKTFETLFALQGACQEGSRKAQATFSGTSYADLFERFYKEDNPAYKCFIGILALCGTLDVNLVDREKEGALEYARMKDFLSKALTTLQDRKAEFLKYYGFAVKFWIQEMLSAGQTNAEIRQNMNLKSRSIDFTRAFRTLRVEADLRI